MSSPVRRPLQIALPVIVVALGALAMQQLAALKQEPMVTPPVVVLPLVTTVSAEPTSIQLTVHTQGVVRPRTETMLVGEVQARVLELSPNFRDGGFFEEGEVLLRLDDTDLRLALEDAKSRLATTDLALTQERADATLSLADWESLRPGETAPPLVAREPQLARAVADQAAARAGLTKAQRDIDRCLVLAPYPGRVYERMVDLGTLVTVGGQLGKVYAIDFAEARLPIPDADLAALELSLSSDDLTVKPAVTLEADFAGESHRWEGRILRTTGVIDPTSRMVVLIAEIEDPYGLARESDRAPLYSGMFVEAWITGRTLNNAIPLPREALQADNTVYILTPDDRLEIRTVDIARAEAERVIVQAGLTPGDRIITSPLETPVANMKLQPKEGTSSAEESEQ
ncbi:MAG: RND family efflux transporter MFP subunit [Planctomycetota bacterium]|jgi:RND family efflux transporter MFP subunit